MNFMNDEHGVPNLIESQGTHCGVSSMGCYSNIELFVTCMSTWVRAPT